MISGTVRTIGIVRKNNFGDSLSIEVALIIDFRDCPWIGIVWTIGVWCFSKIGIAQTIKLGDCPSIEIVLANDFTGCLIIGIAWTTDLGLFTWIGLVGATALGHRPLIGIVRTMGFGSDLLIGVVVTIELKRALLYQSWQLLVEPQLIWTVHNSTIMVVLPLQHDRELSSISRNMQGPFLFHLTSSIYSMGSVYHNTITTVGTRPWHLSSNWFLARHLKWIVRTQFQLLSNRRSPFGQFHLIDCTRNQCADNFSK